MQLKIFGCTSQRCFYFLISQTHDVDLFFNDCIITFSFSWTSCAQSRGFKVFIVISINKINNDFNTIKKKYSHALTHTHTHTLRLACSMSPYCHLAFLRQHFSSSTFVRLQHWIFPSIFFFEKITTRNIFTTRPSSELNTAEQNEKHWELTSSVWPHSAQPLLEGWGKQFELVKKVFSKT